MRVDEVPAWKMARVAAPIGCRCCGAFLVLFLVALAAWPVLWTLAQAAR